MALRTDASDETLPARCLSVFLPLERGPSADVSGSCLICVSPSRRNSQHG